MEELIARIRASAPEVPVTVVDDGSTDGTGEIAGRHADRVLRHDTNKGKGAALKTGFADALDSDIEAVLQLDADLQHEPESLPMFFSAFDSGAWDMIIGARDFRTGSMPWPRRASNRLTSWAVSRLTGVSIRDSQSGYRLISRRVLEVVSPTGDLYDYESEFVILAGQSGFRIGSVPIPTVYSGERSFIRPWRDTARFLRLAGRYWGRRQRRPSRPTVHA